MKEGKKEPSCNLARFSGGILDAWFTRASAAFAATWKVGRTEGREGKEGRKEKREEERKEGR
jgi:hypothetical protein